MDTTGYLNPQNVYRLQEDAHRADRQASDLADVLSRETFHAIRAGAPIGSQDWQHDPAYRALQERAAVYAEVVASTQAALGGRVFRVPGANHAGVIEKLTKLRTRAAKINQSVEWCDQDTELVEHRDGTATRWHYIVLDAQPVKIAGWQFLASLTIEPGGVLVSKIPAAARAWQQQAIVGGNHDDLTVAAQAALDALNLGAYADPTTACDCDHCAKPRRRKTTYLVEHDDGSIKQVGSTCLRDFLGIDPAQILRYAEWLRDLDEAVRDDGEGSGGAAGREISTNSYLAHACGAIRLNGWAPRSSSNYPTSEQARDNLWYSARKTRAKDGTPMWFDLTDADHERALAARQWALDTYGATEPRDLSDFDRNLLVAARGDIVTDKTQGLAAYLPVAHARALERQIEFARQREQAAESVWFGTVGDRTELTLTCTKIFETEGHYGTTFITQFEDEGGNRFKWFGSYELDRGKTYLAKWTVKGHDEYKGVKETVITRPGNLAPVTHEQTKLEVHA